MEPLSTRIAFGKRLLKLAEVDRDFVVCSADTKACGLEHFGELFPGRELNLVLLSKILLMRPLVLPVAEIRFFLPLLRYLQVCVLVNRSGPLSVIRI